MKKTLSLCLLVKDAETTLRNCLDSVKELVDEIIVVDTGSSDNSRNIATAYHAHIYDYDWIADFAAARNFALEKAGSDWILVLDADEILVGDKEKILEVLNATIDEAGKIPLYYFDIFTSTSASQKRQFKYFQKRARLFPNKQGLKFRYSVGEQLVQPTGSDSFQAQALTGVAIKHFMEGGLKSRSKRDVRILKRELKENPQHFYYNYLMGKQCLLHGLLDKAMTSYKMALKSSDYKEEIYLADIGTDMIRTLYRKQDIGEAFNECIRREEVCSQNPDYWLTYGFMALREGDTECAERNFLKCLETPPPGEYLTVDIDNITWKPELLLGYIYLRQKEYEKARVHLEKALERNDQQWQLMLFLGIACRNIKDFNSSEAYFKATEMLVPEEYSQDVQFNILLNYIMSGKFEKANEILKKIIDEFAIEEEEINLIDYEDI